mmetsp:Transcript_3771/g.6437  ORF Transcript_3771/g.6437 Transcript_3771/m.6437 type:complete len:91 (-) Transcript_3771:118-390(-)
MGGQTTTIVKLEENTTLLNGGGGGGNGMYCSRCNCRTNNVIHEEDNTLQWVFCFILFFTTLCCYWIPFFMSGCKKQVTRCGTCRTILATT